MNIYLVSVLRLTSGGSFVVIMCHVLKRKGNAFESAYKYYFGKYCSGEESLMHTGRYAQRVQKSRY